MHRSDVKPRAEVLAEMAAWLEREHTASSCSAGSASRTPMRWRCRSAAPRRSASARSPIWPAARRHFRSPATMNSSAGRNGRRSARPMACNFREQRTDAAGVHVRGRGRIGEVDVIAGYTSDGRIAQHGLVVLDDPKRAIPPYDAVVLVSPRRANDAALLAALRPLAGAIDVELMREANLRATGAGRPPRRRRAGCRTRSPRTRRGSLRNNESSAPCWRMCAHI